MSDIGATGGCDETQGNDAKTQKDSKQKKGTSAKDQDIQAREWIILTPTLQCKVFKSAMDGKSTRSTGFNEDGWF